MSVKNGRVKARLILMEMSDTGGGKYKMTSKRHRYFFASVNEGVMRNDAQRGEVEPASTKKEREMCIMKYDGQREDCICQSR